MDGGLFSHTEDYSSPSFTRKVSFATYSPRKFFSCLYLFLMVVTFALCTQTNNSTKQNNTECKISSSLHSIIEELESKKESKGQVLTFIDKSARVNEQGEIHIYVQLHEIDESTLEDLKKRGLTIDIYDNKQKLVQGWTSIYFALMVDGGSLHG